MKNEKELTKTINLSTLMHDIFNAIEGESVILQQLLNGLHGNTLDDIKPILISLSEANSNSIELIEAYRNHQSINKVLETDQSSINEVDILNLLNNLYQEYYPLSRTRNLELLCEFSTNYVHGTIALGNRTQLHRMLSNLIQNAMQYTKVGSIYLRLLNQKDDLIISIEDTGIGIEPEDLPDIFLPFYRSKKNDLHEPSRSGLGLYIAKMIAKSHNLEIRVSSTVGKGTEFSVVFPYKKGKYGMGDP